LCLKHSPRKAALSLPAIETKQPAVANNGHYKTEQAQPIDVELAVFLLTQTDRFGNNNLIV